MFIDKVSQITKNRKYDKLLNYELKPIEAKKIKAYPIEINLNR